MGLLLFSLNSPSQMGPSQHCSPNAPLSRTEPSMLSNDAGARHGGPLAEGYTLPWAIRHTVT